MKRFNKNPICEECGKNEAISFSFFEDHSRSGACDHATKEEAPRYISAAELQTMTFPDGPARPTRSGTWKFTCECTSHAEDYYIMLDSFFSCPGATVDWLGHMNGKSFMNWHDFMTMMERFQKATDSFGY